MQKKDLTILPAQFSVCVHSDCPVAVTCLHRLAYNELVKAKEYLWLINPDQCTKGLNCKYYRSNTPERYARGFTNFKNKMYPNQYDTFRNLLFGHFSRNGYYERQRGDRALSPKEQQIILNALHQSGVAEDFEFDGYEERINWYD